MGRSLRAIVSPPSERVAATAKTAIHPGLENPVGLLERDRPEGFHQAGNDEDEPSHHWHLGERFCGEAAGAASRPLRARLSSALSNVLASSPNEDIDDLSNELQSLIDGITVNALGQPERYPPERQLAVLARALARFGMTQATSPR